MIKNFSFSFFAYSVALLCIGGCSDNSRPASSANSSPAPTTKPQLDQHPHWVQTKALQSVMQQIAMLQGSVPTEKLPQDVESPANKDAAVALASAAALGDELANTAIKIPAAAQSRQMSDADRNAFVAIAQTLHGQAVDIRDAARAHKVERVQDLVNQLNSTCLSCHTRFRDFAGQLDFQKADLGEFGKRSAVAGR